uniref:Uncharacterized protein n=1 Tax=Tetraselmis sp. GSL018 TaxID=582737 RepID=A0A061RK51_9CHLO|mmetsp:Transcript_2418/g.5727  ORF Transcript_2418/g.5727 Transcript_2418/m.5727 type:complete len:224 (-) Transcript_2418:313-984(-)
MSSFEAREYVRQAQSIVRLAFNKMNRGLDQWKTSRTSGLNILQELANNFLEEQFLKKRELGVLARIEGLADAAINKLRNKRFGLMAQLRKVCKGFGEATALLTTAVEDVRGLSQTQTGLKFKDTAIFKSLPLTFFAELLSGVGSMHAAEAQLKLVILRCLEALVSGRNAGEETCSGAKVAPRPPTDLRPHAMMCCALWSLEPHIQEGRIEAATGMIRDEMAGM